MLLRGGYFERTCRTFNLSYDIVVPNVTRYFYTNKTPTHTVQYYMERQVVWKCARFDVNNGMDYRVLTSKQLVRFFHTGRPPTQVQDDFLCKRKTFYRRCI